MPLVRCQIYVESAGVSSRGYRGRGVARQGMCRAGYRHHGRRTVALSAGTAHCGVAERGVGDFPRNVGHASVQRRFRLGVSVAQASATPSGRGVRTRARVEGNHPKRGGFRVGRAQCGARGALLPPLSATRVERLRAGNAPYRGVRQGESEVVHIGADA